MSPAAAGPSACCTVGRIMPVKRAEKAPPAGYRVCLDPLERVDVERGQRRGLAVLVRLALSFVDGGHELVALLVGEAHRDDIVAQLRRGHQGDEDDRHDTGDDGCADRAPAVKF